MDGGNCWGWEGARCQGAGKEGGPPSLKGDRNRQGHCSLSRMGSCPAHQTIKSSKSRVPGTCPRAQSSKVAPGSQSPPASLQQGRREGVIFSSSWPGGPLERESKAAS